MKSSISNKKLNQAVQHFSHISEYFKIPTSESENQKLIEIVRLLKIQIRDKKELAATKLLAILLQNIEIYEKQAYSTKPLKAADMLKFLMDQHGLNQNNLPEIGTQPHVSKVLHGKRQLTHTQVAALSKRFNVSPAVFYE